MDLFFLILDLAPDRCAACAAIFDVKRSSTQWISTEGQRLEIFSKTAFACCVPCVSPPSNLFGFPMTIPFRKLIS